LSVITGLAAGFGGGVFGDFDLAEHLHGTPAGFRHSGGGAGQHRSGGVFSVQHIVFAIEVSCLPVRAGDLHDTMTASPQVGSQTSAVRPRSLDTKRDLRTQARRPVLQLLITSGANRNRGVGQPAADLGQRHRDVGVLVGIDPHGDALGRRMRDARH
jgi:hypothetical protein